MVEAGPDIGRLFVDALKEVNAKARVDELGYASLEDSLVEGVDADAVRRVFEFADGRPDGRQPRLYAADSPTMMAVNVLMPWLADLGALVAPGGKEFRDMRFEVRLPDPGDDAARYLPVLLISPNGLVGIEPETTGCLSKSPAEFAEQLEPFWRNREENGWRREMLALKQGTSGYARLDAAHLVKQYMGLSLLLDAVGGDGATPVPASLLYLYWEPLNAARFDEFDEHRAEIDRFAAAVAGSEIAFAAMNWFDLWAAWAREAAPHWLAMHLTRLHQRYSLRI